MSIRLLPRQALVIVGPQGSGKATLARVTAAQYGTFTVCEFERLAGYFGLHRVLAERPATVIVEGIWKKAEQANWVRRLVVAESVEVDVRGRHSQRVPVPNFIFCTEHLRDDPGRPFVVVRLG